MTKEEFDKLEWQRISYKESDSLSCTWEHHRWYIKRQIVQPLKKRETFWQKPQNLFL